MSGRPSAGQPGAWWLGDAEVSEVEALQLSLPRGGPPDVRVGQPVASRRLSERLRALRLELRDDGRLSAHWGHGTGYSCWTGEWRRLDAGVGAVAGARDAVAATDASGASLDGWLTRTADGARLDALYLSPGNGGTWPTAARVRVAMRDVGAAETAPPERVPREEPDPGPWGRAYEGVLVPESAGTELPGEPVSITFGPAPRVCGETAAPAMVLSSLDRIAEGAVLWIAHCADSAAFALETPRGGEDAALLSVVYRPEHEDVGAPIWNVRDRRLPDFVLPMAAEHGRLRLTLRGDRMVGEIELEGAHPFDGRKSHRARLDVRDTAGVTAAPPESRPEEPPPARTLEGRWLRLVGPIAELRLTEREFRFDGGDTVLRLLRAADLAVGLVSDGSRTVADAVPALAVLERPEQPSLPAEAAALWHDRVELRVLAEKSVLNRHYAEARPLLDRALDLYRRAAAAARLPGARQNEEISALRILDHQTLCDAALRDHEALVDRLTAAARLRAKLLSEGRPGGVAPFTRELVVGTLLTMLGQAHRLGYWRAMLDTDEERIAQLQVAEPFHHRLVTVLLELDEPEAAFLAAEAGRARAFADLLGRAAPEPPGIRPERRGGGTSWVRGAPPPLNAGGLRGLLARHGRPVVAYYLTEDRVVRWIAGPDGAVTVREREVSRSRLADAVTAVRLAGLDGAGTPAKAREALAWLGELLWPAECDALLPADPDVPVTVVTHGPISQLPFAALPDADGRPLVARHAVAVLPALSLLEGLLDRRDARRARSAGPPRLLAFVDPEPMPGNLPALTWTREAFPGIVEQYGTAHSTVYSGTAATLSRFVESAGDAAVLCLATHAEAYGVTGEADSTGDPMDSYVAFARTSDHDGRFRARDLPGVRIGADLVILSSCEGGAGRAGADGVIGLGRSFLVRGPTAVVLALSPVHEQECLDIVHRFHEHWLHEGMSRAAALRRAQLAWAQMYPDEPGRWARLALLGLGD